MILEHVVLDIRPEQEHAFEAAFAEAKPLIMASPGCQWLQLQRCLENESRYLLLVGWETLSDHLEGFRGSPAYEEWRRLLHHFYDPPPVVEHFEVVTEA
jgi:heme-degrading monooxygenase HmoA